MKKKVWIYGAGGLGREVLSLIRMTDEWEAIGFIDDDIRKGTIVKGLPVQGGIGILTENTHVVIAIGNPVVKSSVAEKLKKSGVLHPVLIHPSAIIQDSHSIRIGRGSIITAGCILTTDIIIGDHVLVNLKTTIGHDTKIGDNTSIMPGVNIAGEVTIGESVLIGSGCNIMNRVRIGDRSKVGMGSLVRKNVPAGVTVAGVPAKLLTE